VIAPPTLEERRNDDGVDERPKLKPRSSGRARGAWGLPSFTVLAQRNQSKESSAARQLGAEPVGTDLIRFYWHHERERPREGA